MERSHLQNGVRIIYEKRRGTLTSFCIGFEAGALSEDENSIGLAHAVEHMLFKGTKTKNEFEINEHCEEIFGFHNAMTNYPYAIYYGTTLSENFLDGFNIYSDILLNPSFPQLGFKEEISIISAELMDWKDDIAQYCEDSLFFNAFNLRRIKELIIGDDKYLKGFNLNHVRKFYEEYYCPKNCVISVVSSLSFEEVLKIVKNNFENWDSSFDKEIKVIYEDNLSCTNYKEKGGIEGVKIQFCFPIHHLNRRETTILKIINLYLGEGTSSVLYNEVRTLRGIAYDIYGEVKDEKGIMLYNIKLSTSKENMNNAIDIINKKLEEIKYSENVFEEDKINKLIKRYKLKNELKYERSVELCKSITVNELMYNSIDEIFEIDKVIRNLSEEEIITTIKKVFLNPTIQVIY